MTKKQITLKQMHEFFQFLQGTIPREIKLPKKHILHLTPDQAFLIIWYLQEHLPIIPENFEFCYGCKRIFDTNDEGYSVTRGRIYGNECCSGGK